MAKSKTVKKVASVLSDARITELGPHLGFTIERKARNSTDPNAWERCRQWWGHNQCDDVWMYRRGVRSPLARLFEELDQAGRDGEACIFNREEIAEICEYLTEFL